MHFKVTEGNLQNIFFSFIYIHILISCTDLDPGSGCKVLQRDKIFRKVGVGCD